MLPQRSRRSKLGRKENAVGTSIKPTFARYSSVKVSLTDVNASSGREFKLLSDKSRYTSEVNDCIQPGHLVRPTLANVNSRTVLQSTRNVALFQSTICVSSIVRVVILLGFPNASGSLVNKAPVNMSVRNVSVEFCKASSEMLTTGFLRKATETRFAGRLFLDIVVTNPS